MSTTKDRILQVARKLFNKYGYDAVSIKDIADELGISKGNLTYHFAKKTDIVRALLKENDVTMITNPKPTLEALREILLDMQQTIQANYFYFRSYTQLADLLPDIQQAQKRVYALYSTTMQQLFTDLSRNGIMREENAPKEFERVANAVFMTFIYWLPFSELADLPKTDAFDQAWSLVETLLK